MIKKLKITKIIAMTMAVFMLPWSSFIYGDTVEAKSLDITNVISTKDITSTSGDADITSDEKDSQEDNDSNQDEPEDEVVTYDDLVVTGSVNLNEDMEVGSVTINNDSSLNLNGHTLTCHGDFSIGYRASLTFNNGEILCDGSFTSDQAYSSINMQNLNDYLLVCGKLELTTGTIKATNGCIEAKGDVNIANCFAALNDNTFIFSGNTEQNLSQTAGSKFGKVILKNYSEEGIIINNAFNYDELQQNGCNVRLSDQEGISGYTLTEDEEKDGLFILSAGTLDLNGHTLTINGDFFHTGGKLKVNNGKLIINGSYRMQKRVIDEDDVTYVSADSQLEMSGQEDYIFIADDLVVDNAGNTSNLITDGTIEILGDIVLDNSSFGYGFIPSGNNTILMSSENPQSIEIKGSISSSYSHINNLILNNTSEEGVIFSSPVCISGTFDQGETITSGELYLGGDVEFTIGTYTGNITVVNSTNIKGNLVLQGNLTVNNSLTIDGTTSISGNITNNSEIIVNGSLSSGDYYDNGNTNVSGSFYVSGNVKSDAALRTIVFNNGYLEVSQNVSNIKFNMSHEDDHALIYGDYNSSYSNNTKTLTNGTLEIKGDIDSLALAAYGNNKLLLSGDNLQTISNSDKIALGILELNNKSEEGVFFDKVVEKSQLIRNDCRLRFGNLEGEFGWTLDSDQEIEGDLIIIDDELNLNGHRLHVSGNLTQMSGNLNINGGELIVDGDYRMQSKNEDSDYTLSASTLTMTNELDKVTVKGDYYAWTSINNGGALTNGVFELGGNLNISDSSNINAFCGTGDFKLLLNGSNDQSITSGRAFYIPVLELKNQGTITADNKVVVSKELISEYTSSYSGTVEINYNTVLSGDGFSGSLESDGHTFDAPYHIGGDYKNSGTVYFKSDVTIDGDYIRNSNANVYNHLNIHGNATDLYSRNSTYISLNDSAEVNVDGNMSYSYTTVYLSGDNASIKVSGDITSIKGSPSKGTISVGGDFSSSSFTASGTNKVILNGDKLQTIDVSSSCKFATIELSNNSDDGVISKTVFNKDTFIRNNTKFRYEGLEGTFGYTLDKDEFIDGDFILLDDTLDLNGHTLSVSGDFIQMSGCVNVNKGNLIIDGDYRQESQLDGKTSVSSSKLIMKNNEDLICIGGDFIINSSVNNYGNQTDGIIELKGDLSFNSKNNDSGFYPTENLCLKLTGEKEQSLKSENGRKDSLLYLASLYIESEDEDYKLSGSSISISNELKTNNVTVEPQIFLNSGSKLISETYNGDLYVRTQLKDNLVINGILSGAPDISGNVIVNGSGNMDSLSMNGGTLEVSGDLSVKGLYMTHESDKITVHGDYNHGTAATRLTNGELLIGGDFTNVNTAFNASGNHKVILDGTEKQTISNPYGHFATLELRNYSTEGVYSNSIFKYDKLIKNGCKLSYGFGNTTDGFVLEGDYTHTGDLIFVDGEIDLNGHTLTIDGSLIHAGGTININGGKLIINKDLREQSPNENEYIEGQGTLIMENDQDTVIVDGGVYLDSNKTSRMKTGSIYIGGNLSRTIGNKNFDFETKIILDSDDSQTINGNVQGLSYLEINTKNKLTIGSGSLTISKSLSSTCRNINNNICVNTLSTIESPYYGNIVLSKADSLKDDVEIIGTLTVNNKLDINGKNLYVNDFVIGNYGSLVMDAEDDYISVSNNMSVLTPNKYISTYNSVLKDGTIEINGNFSSQRYQLFTATGNHKVILTPKKRKSGSSYKQSVSFGTMTNRTSRFNTLILRGKETDFSFDNDISTVANEVIYEYDGADELRPVTDLIVTKATESQITISFADDNTDPKASGYEIYRNGVKIGTTDRTEYTDRNLKPNTRYNYTVYAIDSYWNLSAESETLVATTLKDTEAPSIPASLHVSSRTGNTVGLSWAGSKDNVGVSGYFLYRDGEELDRNITSLEYKDTDVVADKVYSYELSAVDAAGNESDKCEAVITTVATPKINSISPADYKRIGGDSVQLKVFYKNYGEGSRNNVNIEYMNDSKEWVRINDAPIGQTLYSSSEYVSSYNWNIGNLSSDRVTVRYILTDASGAEDIFETEYEVDHTAPDSPEDVNVDDNDGVAELSWKISGESDFSRYNIYRYVVNESDSKELYSKVSSIEDRYSVSYSDPSLKEGDVVKYIVTAEDDMGNESLRINPVSVTIGEDHIDPEITEIEPETERVSGKTEFTAYAKDNKEVRSIYFYIFSDDTDDSWILLGEKEAVQDEGNIYKASYSVDTSLYTDGIYYIAAVAVDGSGNESEEDFCKRYEIDNIGIQRISINKTNAGTTYVQLMWDDVTDEDFSYFSIEQKVGYTFKEVAQEKSVTGATIGGLEPETMYSFRVCGVDTLGNKGEYSDVVSVTTLADTSAPSITAVYPVQGRVRDNIPLRMSVTDNYKAAGGTWSLSFDGENYEVIATASGSNASETFRYTLDISDEEKYPEGSIYIKSEAVDAAGNKNLLTSDDSEIIMEYIIDRTAPASIQNVSARASDGYIGLTWDESSEEDITAYKVYKADMDKGNYRCVMNSASLNYYDTDIDAGESYAYYVTAVDEAGNESEKSNVSFATAVPDETDPKVEGVSPSDGSNIGASTDFSIIVTDNSYLSCVKTYYRTNDAEPWVLLNESSVSGRSAWPTFTADFKNEKEGDIYFRTICEDRNGNVSNDYLYKCTLDKTAPKADIASIGGNFEIYVDLTRDMSETDISYYEIYRCELSRSGKNKSFFENAESIEKVTLDDEELVDDEFGKKRIRFTDTDIIPHTAYRYAAKVYDKVGNYSWTDIVNAVATDIDTVSPTIVMPDKITTVVGMEVDLDAGNCTDNVKIRSFKWDMGNGNVVSGARPKYKYTEGGNYTVKLTVTDTAGNTDEKDIEVSVKETSNSGICNLTVVDYSGNPIPYAYVYVNSGSDSNSSFMTDAYGKVSLCYKSGTYKVAAFKDGYLPEEQEYTITNMKTTEEVLKLSSGEVVVGNFEVKRMSLQEIVDAGVDLSSPANINTFTFKTTLTFQKTPIPVTVEEIQGELIIEKGDDVKSGGGSKNKPKDDNHGESEAETKKNHYEYIDCSGIGFATPLPVLAILHTTQSVSWLKTMYSATLTIINNADSKYVIEDSKGSITLPEGVSLAVLDSEKRKENGTVSGQKYTYDMGDIE
ncbi:MAG: PKD domain-containing protein [Eubacterium sp.]|nr:PKD domain-containing protein [Eubacterium sp.]